MSVCLRPAGGLFHVQPWAGSRETSVPKLAVGLLDDTSPLVCALNGVSVFVIRLAMTYARTC